jgi:hypothetical protein
LGKNFGHWRQEVIFPLQPNLLAAQEFTRRCLFQALIAAQSGYLFTIMLGQMACMMCVKTRFTSLFKRGLDNKYEKRMLLQDFTFGIDPFTQGL